MKVIVNKIKITKQDPFTGKYNTMKLAVTPDQLDAWRHGMLIQDAMPQLSPSEREFLISGITPERWNTIFGVSPRENDTDASQEVEDLVSNEMAPENDAYPEENYQHEN